MKLKSKIYLDYDDIESMNQNLVHEVSRFKPDLIVGITRGGLLPALHLSHHLDRPLQTIVWQTRDTNKCEHDKQLQEKIDTGSRVVFVDDINDTGRTFSEISKAYHGDRDNVMFISLVKKYWETSYPATASLILSDNRWIVFPWETD